MSRPTFPLPPRAPRGAPRTYLVLALGAAAGEYDGFARPLGTVAAASRARAREAARLLFPGVAAEELRVVSAAGAPAGLVAGALSADGRALLAAS